MNGLLVVLAGPSAVGKTTLAETLVQRFRRIAAIKTISSTTRPMRAGEVDGIHYHFISRAQFQAQIERGEFLEYATYSGHLDGTSRPMAQQLLEQSRLVIATLELNGCRQLITAGLNLLICPVIPDKVTVLEERLRTRPGVVDYADIARRLAETQRELAAIASGEFGEPVVNEHGRMITAVEEIRRRIETRLHAL